MPRSMTQTRWLLPKRVSMAVTICLTVCQVAGVAGQGVMGQGKALAGDDQGDDDLLAIAAMIARVAALGQVVVLGQALEVAAGQIVQQQIVVELKERAEALLQVVLDGVLGLAGAGRGCDRGDPW